MTSTPRTLHKRMALKLPGVLLALGLFFTFFGYALAQQVEPVANQNEIPEFNFDVNNDLPPPAAQSPIIIGDSFLDSLYGFIIIFGGKLVGWMGDLLNWAIEDFVIGFGDIYLTWGVGVAVENGWKIIRDILNISFIFGIVFIGLRLIFDADDSSAKRSLGYLLAAALLINFSLFISKFVVDFSNSLAAVIYNTGLKTASADLGASFINMLGLSTLVDNGGGTLTVGSEISGGLAIVFGTFIFMLLAAYALAAGAFLIFVRGIALIFFMIFSPVMFLGWIFPQFKSFTSKYWGMFLSNAFMAPAYLFCIYLTFSIMSGFKYQIKTTGGGSMGNLFAETYTGNVNALIVFTLAIGMMLASISIAKRMGAFGGGLVVSVGNSMRKSGQSFVGRNSVGRVAGGAGWVNEKMDNRLNRNAVGRFVNQNLLAQRSRQNIINSGKSAKFGGSYSRADDKKYAQGQQEGGFNAKKNAEIDSVINAGVSALAVNSSSRSEDQHEAVRRLNSIVPTLGKTKIEEMSDKNRNAVSHLFTASQIKEFEKSDKASEASKSALSSARTVAIRAKVETGGKTDPAKASKISKTEIEALGSTWIAKNAHLLTPSQFDEIKKSDSFNPEEKAFFASERNRLLTELTQPNNAAVLEDYLKAIKDKQKEIASLPIDVLKNMTTAKYINSKVIKEIDKNTDISRTDKIFIGYNIMNLPSGVNRDGRDYLATPKMMGAESEWI